MQKDHLGLPLNLKSSNKHTLHQSCFSGEICTSQQTGGSPLSSEALQEAISLASTHSKEILNALNSLT